MSKKNKEDLRKTLSPMEFYVTQENGTEAPFENQFWDHKEEGIYVDVVSGEVLFSSKDKFDSGCGWPSFTQPIKGTSIVEKEDFSMAKINQERVIVGFSERGKVTNIQTMKKIENI